MSNLIQVFCNVETLLKAQGAATKTKHNMSKSQNALILHVKREICVFRHESVDSVFQ